MLEAAKNLKIDQIVITSTSETYGTAQTVPIKENHRLLDSPHTLPQKISADQIAISYWRSFGTQ